MPVSNCGKCPSGRSPFSGIRIKLENQHIPSPGKYRDTLIVDDDNNSGWFYSCTGSYVALRTQPGRSPLIGYNKFVKIIDAGNVPQTVILEHVPVRPSTEMRVIMGGLEQTEGLPYDYVVDGNKIVFNNPIDPIDGVKIVYLAEVVEGEL
jgi:hypothetical protein